MLPGVFSFLPGKRQTGYITPTLLVSDIIYICTKFIHMTAIFFIVFFGLCLILFWSIVLCETYAMRNPDARFSIWWRRYFLYHDEDNRFD